MTCRKVSFINEQFAKDYIKKLKSTSVRYKVPKRAYLCEICLNWHLTSSPEQYDDRTVSKWEMKISNLQDQLEAQKAISDARKIKIDNQKVIIKQQYDLIKSIRQRLGYIR